MKPNTLTSPPTAEPQHGGPETHRQAKSEIPFPDVAGNVPALLCRIDQDGMVAWAGDRWTDLGYTDGQPKALSWTDLIHEEDREAGLASLERTRRTASGTESVWARTCDAQGTYTWCRWVFWKSSDRSVMGLALDATKEHEDFEQYRLGIEASPTGLLMVDEDGQICLVNRQIEVMFGYDRQELLGEPVEKLVPEQYRPRHPAVRKRFLASPVTRSMGQGRDLFGVRKDGTEFAIEIGLNPLGMQSGTRVLASIVDVTARKKQELELRARVTELQQYQEEMDLLSEMSSLLQHALHEDEAHDIVAGFGRRLLSSVDVGIYALRSSRDALEVKSSWGTAPPPARFGAAECWALRRTQLHRADYGEDNEHSSPHCSHRSKSPIAWQTCIPMSAHGQSSGIVSLASSKDVADSERHNLERVGKAIADQLALALSNIHLRESLRAMALRDPLTGLFNRRYLEESVKRELQRAKRRESEVSVLMIDIDHFKRFNDTHGHQTGDEALSEVGRLLLDSIREEDIACRFGGEEFVVLMPDCSREDAFTRAERLREVIANRPVGVTLSIGVSAWPNDGRTWEMVLKKADEALYDAKSNGRNRSAMPP